MKRRLLNLTTVASLALCVAVVVTWVRSYWISNVYVLGGTGATFTTISIEDGCAFLATHYFPIPSRRIDVVYGYSGEPSRRRAIVPSIPRTAWWPSMANGALASDRTTDFAVVRGTMDQVSLPLWLVAAVAAGLPAGRVAARYASKERAAARRLVGRCPSCGYDLRATPERCPECGTAAP